jgi:hypothetical protein
VLAVCAYIVSVPLRVEDNQMKEKDEEHRMLPRVLWVEEYRLVHRGIAFSRWEGTSLIEREIRRNPLG